LPTLLQKGSQKKHPYLYWEYPEVGSSQAIRMGKWKAIRSNIRKGNMKIQLFNLETDIREENDVAAQNPEIVQKIEKILKEAHTPAELPRFRQKQLGDK
jgi:arylsulfatase